MEVVFPNDCHSLGAANLKTVDLVDDTRRLYHQKLFEEKRSQLQRMELVMQKACLALEQVSPALFRKAMVKDVALRFPLERRPPVDQPPRIGWNHSNALRTDGRK
jgi:Mitochondrial ribosomal protein L28